jgi:hypothetical protein
MTFVVRLAWRRTTESEVFAVRLILTRTANETKKEKNYNRARQPAGHHSARAGRR